MIFLMAGTFLISSCAGKQVSRPAVSLFVSPTGNDANPGTIDQPRQNIQGAVNAANPGDTIFLRGGSYPESVKITRSGSAGLPITLSNYNGELAIVDGSSNIALYSNGPISYWIIEGLNIRSTNKHTIRFGWFDEAITSYINIKNNYIWGAVFTIGNNQLFEDNEIDGTDYRNADGYGGINDSHGGFGDNATHHNIYRHNFIHDFTNYNARGIWSQGRTHDNVIELNRIVNRWSSGSGLGQCIDLDAGQSGLVQWRQTVRKNTVVDCSYVGIQIENVFASILEDNFVDAENGGNAGVMIINYSPTIGCGVGGENNQYGDTNGDNSCEGDITNNIVQQNIIFTKGSWSWGYGGLVNWGVGGLTIQNNTFYAASSVGGNAAINFQESASATSQTVIKNNILYNATAPAICALDFDSFSQDNHNLLYSDTANAVYGRGTNCMEVFSLTNYNLGTGKGENSIQANPEFANRVVGDFHLLSTSPAIDKGDMVNISTDFDGNARPQGAGYDIGAFETVAQ